jgi:hypothetical protein
MDIPKIDRTSSKGTYRIKIAMIKVKSPASNPDKRCLLRVIERKTIAAPVNINSSNGAFTIPPLAFLV